MKEKKQEDEDGWTCSSYSFAAYAGFCLFQIMISNENRNLENYNIIDH